MRCRISERESFKIVSKVLMCVPAGLMTIAELEERDFGMSNVEC